MESQHRMNVAGWPLVGKSRQKEPAWWPIGPYLDGVPRSPLHFPMRIARLRPERRESRIPLNRMPNGPDCVKLEDGFPPAKWNDRHWSSTCCYSASADSPPVTSICNKGPSNLLSPYATCKAPSWSPHLQRNQEIGNFTTQFTPQWAAQFFCYLTLHLPAWLSTNIVTVQYKNWRLLAQVLLFKLTW